MKLRISRRVLLFLEGGQLFATPDALDRHGYGEAGRSLVEKVAAAPTRKDGSVTVDLTGPEADIVCDYAEAMYAGAKDNVGGGRYSGLDQDSVADLNAARACIDACGRLLGVR